MSEIDRQSLAERDIRTTFVTPALRNAGRDELHRLREEVTFTNGRIVVRGKLESRVRARRADCILYWGSPYKWLKNSRFAI